MMALNHHPDGAVISSQSRKELIVFAAICFAALWIPLALMIFAGPQFERAVGDATGGVVGPILFLALGALSPTIAGIGLTAFWRGWGGVKEHMARMFRWRVGLNWWVIAFVSIPLAYMAGAAARHLIAGGPAPDFSIWYWTVPLLIAQGLVLSDSGPLGEEFGLRGYALPRLLEGFSPFTAALLLGIVWSIWHLPAFFIPGQSQANWSFWVFLVMPIGTSLFMTWIHINTRGSGLLSGIIPHLMVNSDVAAGGGMVGTWAGTFALLGLGFLAVWLGRRDFFRRSDEFVFLRTPAASARASTLA